MVCIRIQAFGQFMEPTPHRSSPLAYFCIFTCNTSAYKSTVIPRVSRGILSTNQRLSHFLERFPHVSLVASRSLKYRAIQPIFTIVSLSSPRRIPAVELATQRECVFACLIPPQNCKNLVLLRGCGEVTSNSPPLFVSLRNLQPTVLSCGRAMRCVWCGIH